MLDINAWMDHFNEEILKCFPGRIEVIGLQGSYARQEATDASDIDVVVIFDRLDMDDLKRYDGVISQLPHREKICGFVSGKAELLHWERADLFQFCYDTKVLYGNFDCVFSLIQPEDVRRAVRVGCGNLYHACCHNILHEKSIEILQALYKQAVFVLQAKCFLETGSYAARKSDLSEWLSLDDRRILELYFSVKNGVGADEFDACSEALWTWAGRCLLSLPQTFS